MLGIIVYFFKKKMNYNHDIKKNDDEIYDIKEQLTQLQTINKIDFKMDEYKNNFIKFETLNTETLKSFSQALSQQSSLINNFKLQAMINLNDLNKEVKSKYEIITKE